MGDSAHTTHHTASDMTHCHKKYVSKYLSSTTSNIGHTAVSRQGFGSPIDLRGENRAWKFPFIRIFDGNGSTKRPFTYNQMDSTQISRIDDFTVALVKCMVKYSVDIRSFFVVCYANFRGEL